MKQRKIVYISGPIKGVDKYWEAFEKAEDELFASGFLPLSPSRLPADLTESQLGHLGAATIDIADAVLFLPGWENSKIAKMEMKYCINTDTPIFTEVSKLKEAENAQ